VFSSTFIVCGLDKIFVNRAKINYHKTVVLYLILFLLFGLPFFILPFSFSPYELPKVIAFLLAISITSGWLLFKNFRQISLSSFFSLHLLIFYILMGLGLYHLLLSGFSQDLLWGNVWRPQGTLPYLALFLLFIYTKQLPFNKNLFAKTAAWSLTLVLLLTFIIGPRESFRFIGPLGEANSLGATVLFFFPFITILPKSKLKSGSLFAAIALVLLTGSRSSLLGLFAESVILFLLPYRRLFITGSLITLFLFIFALILPLIPHPIPADVSLRFENRADVWTVAVAAGTRYPFLGTGFGSIQESLKEQAILTDHFLRLQPVDSAHNLFLNWWISTGLTGVILLTAIIILVLLNLYKSGQIILFSSLIGLLLIQSFNPVSIVTLIHFWWLLGIGLKTSSG